MGQHVRWIIGSSVSWTENQSRCMCAPFHPLPPPGPPSPVPPVAVTYPIPAKFSCISGTNDGPPACNVRTPMHNGLYAAGTAVLFGIEWHWEGNVDRRTRELGEGGRGGKTQRASNKIISLEFFINNAVVREARRQWEREFRNKEHPPHNSCGVDARTRKFTASIVLHNSCQLSRYMRLAVIPPVPR